MHLIIDCDPVVYRCGFAAQRTEYNLIVEDKNGNVSEVHFAPGSKETAGERMNKWINKNPDKTILEREDIVFAEPEESAREAVRTQLYSIENECESRYGEIDRITTVLSGPGNYRERIATIFPYKGNRDPDHKPVWYQSIRNYLTTEWGAIVVSGREADDECAILAERCRIDGVDYCIATIDKDLDQIPGKHYNYMKQVFYEQSEEDADMWFWQQVLSGDATDGIPGCYKIGATKAARIIADIYPAPRERIWQEIVGAYQASQERKGCVYADKDAESVALETARLVYLQQYPGQLWNPDGHHDLLEEFRDDE